MSKKEEKITDLQFELDKLMQPSEPTEGCVQIGQEVTEVLELTLASFYVKRYVRPKYARQNDEGILIAIFDARLPPAWPPIPSQTSISLPNFVSDSPKKPDFLDPHLVD